MLNSVKAKIKGAHWIRIFYHHMPLGGPFSSTEEAKHFIGEYKFSIIEDVSRDPKYKYNGKYEFLIKFSQIAGFNWWRQSIFPLFEDDNLSIGSTVTGYEPVSISWKTNNWGGLAHTVREYSQCVPCLLDGSIKSDTFFYTIGYNNCNNLYPTSTPPNDNPGTTDVSLWMRISSSFLQSCKPHRRRSVFNAPIIIMMIIISY